MAATMRKRLNQTMAALMLLCAPIAIYAQEVPPPAYQLAAQDAGIPSEVLFAVALTESGMRIENKVIPWPWTLNVAGQGRFFKTRQDACLALTETLKTVSAKRVDVGLAQINYGYHGQRVTTPCDLLDPYLNLSIAADILKSQHREGEDWLIAIGRYHSPANGSHAQKYRLVAQTHLNRITSND